MEFRQITAIIRAEMLEAVEKRLRQGGAKGVSVAQVKGYGQYADFFARDRMVTHVRLDIFAEAAKVEGIVAAVMEAASTGSAGDGIVAVLPVEQVYRVRNRCRIQPDEL